MSTRPEPELRTWLDDLFALFAAVLGALNRKNAAFVRRAVRVMAPYAVRNLSRHKLRGALLALSIALALVSYLVFTAYFAAAQLRLTGRVAPLHLGEGIDAVVLAGYGPGRAFPADIASRPSVLARAGRTSGGGYPVHQPGRRPILGPGANGTGAAGGHPGGGTLAAGRG